MMENKVIIILNSYNRENLILDTLKSISVQTHSNFKCIIVDDFSTDQTKDIILNFASKDARFILAEKNDYIQKGLSAGRNYGIKLAEKYSPDFLQFFDDDDIMHPQKLQLQIEDLKCDEKAMFSLCGAKNFISINDIDWKGDQFKLELFNWSLADAYLYGNIKFVAQVPLFRYSYAKNFIFNENLFYAEEWVLFVKDFYEKNPRFSFVEKTLFYRRKHTNSITEGKDLKYEKRKTSAITDSIIFDHLTKNNLHSKRSLYFFIRHFLIYRYNFNSLKEIEYILIDNRSYNKLDLLKFKIAIYFHFVFRKITLRILKI